MADCNLNSLSSQVEVLMETQPDFPQRLSRLLFLELNKMENHFQFIGELISKGVLCDGSTDSEVSFGLKEIMAQHAIMVACTKGANKIGCLMESLEESGNPRLVSALRTWVKEDFGVETGSDLSQAQEDIATLHTPRSEKLTQQMKSPAESTSSGTKLIDKVMAKMENKKCLEQLEGHLIGKASKIVNEHEFCSSLSHQNFWDGSDEELKSGPQLGTGKWTETVIKAACSKRAIGSLVLALQLSGNERILEGALEWLETSQAKKNNYPISVKSLEHQRITEESQVLTSTFFQQSALSHGISMLATFKCKQKSFTKGIFSVQFDKTRMIACATDGSLNLWSWRDKKEESIQIAVNAKNITCVQYDEGILVVGTADGSVDLFDATTFERKSSVKLNDEPVISLKFVQSTVGVITGGFDQVWWIDISRPDMRFISHRRLKTWGSGKNRFPWLRMFPDVSFVCSTSYADAYETKSGKIMYDDKNLSSFLVADAVDMRTLTVGNLICSKRVAVAGCQNGAIVMWNTSKLCSEQEPVKTFRGQDQPIMSLCFLNGHLLSLDESGKLLMWSGHDLGRKKAIPAPQILLKKSTSTYLTSDERWFVTCSSEDDIINMWTVPDLWLRTGGSGSV